MLLRSDAFRLSSVCEDVRKTLALEARRKGLEFVFDVSPAVPDMVLGDTVRLGQILINLAGNAVKFTEAGEVIVRVTTAAAAGEICRVLFEVSDTGRGIPADRQLDIFDAFVQVDGSDTRRHGGTGLGLSICSHLVKLMGGTISVESRPGMGSTFSFTVPFIVPPASDVREPEVRRSMDQMLPAPVPGDSGHGLRVLVAEDNAVNQKLLCRVLEKQGHSVIVTENGHDAVEAFRQTPFDLVLMDLQMPIMGGLEATRKIRALETSHSGHTPIFAVTAFTEQSDRQKCFEVGMNEYITKPVHTRELLNAIDRHLPAWNGPAATAGGTTSSLRQVLQ